MSRPFYLPHYKSNEREMVIVMNRVFLVGRLTDEPKLTYTPNGVAIANFTLAVNRTYTNQEGKREADFIRIVVFRKAAENVANYLKKGYLTGIDGRLQSRSYEDQNKKRVYITEVVAESVNFLERKPQKQGNQQPAPNTKKVPVPYDDDLPY